MNALFNKDNERNKSIVGFTLLLLLLLLPPLRGRGLEKVALKNPCFSTILPAYCRWLDIHFCGRKIRKNKINFGAWNVRTLMGAECSPECMTAIDGHELARYNIAMAALGEGRKADTGCLKEMRAHYTFFWSDKTRDQTTHLRFWLCH